MRRAAALVAVTGLVLGLALVFLRPTKPPVCGGNQLAVGASLGVDVPARPVPVALSNAPLTARVATWNTLYTNTTDRVLTGLKALSQVSDVIGAQELFSAARRTAAAQSLARQGWATVVGADSAVPIFYNAAKYKILAHDTVKEFDVTRIEPGASGTSIGPRWLQWAQLQDRSTGAVLFVVNDHIIPDIERAGHPRSDAPQRIAIYQQQRAIAASVIAKLRLYGPVAFTEDSNIDARADQRVQDPGFDYAQMRRAGMVSNWTALGMPGRGTQVTGSRLIDKVWLTQDTGRFLQQTQLPAYGSDHHPQVVTIAANPHTGSGSSDSAAMQQLPSSLSVPGVSLNSQQIKIAATAIEVGKQFNIPERGWIVAIASGLQESGLHNLDGGNRDSAGWQQQRPKAGWGTLAQIRNVRLATMAFYGVARHTHNPGLIDIKGWQQLSIAAAAQAVQVSAFPTAYAKWEAPATAIVDKLAGLAGATGADSSGSDCGYGGADLTGNCPPTTMPAEKVLSHDALLVLRCVAAQFPTIHDISTYPGHEPDESRAVDIMIPSWQTDAGKALGNQIAGWVRAHQGELGVQYVIWSARIWNIERNDEGWRTYSSITGHDDPSSLHYNHVHVSVYGDRGTGPGGSSDVTATGGWHIPVGQPFSVGCGFGCYPGHTGQDFPAAPGTPVYAVTDGTIVKSESITASGTCTTLPICGGTKISYGNLLVIRLAGGGDTTAWYAHLTERRVGVGQTVHAGQIIGTVGYQGHVIPQGPRGAHLHFEIRRGGTPINPLPYLHSKGIQP